MIVKIQRPVFQPDAPVLIYNEDRSFMFQVQMTPHIKRFFGNDDLKIYCELERIDSNTMKISHRVPDQDW